MNQEEKFNEYLTHLEAVKQAVVPGYKSDWPSEEADSSDSSDDSSDDEDLNEEEIQNETPTTQDQTENPE